MHSHIIILTWWIRLFDHRSTNNNNKIWPQWLTTSRTMGASEIFRISAANALRRFNNSNFSIWVQMPLTFEHLRFRTVYISPTLSRLTVLRVNVIIIQTSSNLDNNNLNKYLWTTLLWLLTRLLLCLMDQMVEWFYHPDKATTTRNLMHLHLAVITKKHSLLVRSQGSLRTSWVAMEAPLRQHRCPIS